MTISKEEQARNQRRRRRQLWGVAICIFVLIGIGSVVHAVSNGIVSLFDQSEEYTLYENRLEGMVMFDPLPFEGIENMNDATLRSVAVWGTVYDILDTEYGLSVYTRDEATDMALIPSVEVDAYLARLLGPGFKLDHHSFEGEEEMTITYDDVRQCYLIPVTSMVGSYTPRVVDITKKSGQLYVTVGYLPTNDEADLTTTNTNPEPVKYMDYVFSSTAGNWYLNALKESERKVEVAETPVPTVTPAPEQEVDQAILAGVSGQDPAATTDPAAPVVPDPAAPAPADPAAPAAPTEPTPAPESGEATATDPIPAG